MCATLLIFIIVGAQAILMSGWSAILAEPGSAYRLYKEEETIAKMKDFKMIKAKWLKDFRIRKEYEAQKEEFKTYEVKRRKEMNILKNL